MHEKPRHRFRFGLISLFALIAAIGVLACFWNPFKLPPSKANLRLIEDGMTIAEVMALVGPPDYFATNETQTWHAYEDRTRENWVIVFADGKVITNSPPHRNVGSRNCGGHTCRLHALMDENQYRAPQARLADRRPKAIRIGVVNWTIIALAAIVLLGLAYWFFAPIASVPVPRS